MSRLFIYFSRTSDLYTAAEAKKHLNTYINSQNLKHPSDPSYVVSDELLKRSLLHKDENNNKDFIARGDLAERLIVCMQDWHSYTPGQDETIFRFLIFFNFFFLYRHFLKRSFLFCLEKDLVQLLKSSSKLKRENKD